LPWQVDVPEDRVPYANYSIIGSVVFVSLLHIILIFVLGSGRYVHNPEKIKQFTGVLNILNTLVLDGFSLPGLVGHMWLHADLIHLGCNMWFLWIFGNAVCAKVGNGYYVLIYLLLGIYAAATHVVFQSGWAIGASGAINGIVGLYLALFPQNNITCYFFMWFFLRGVWREVTVSSFWIILLWFALDIFGVVRSGGNVAYLAHIGGFAAGFGLGMTLLLVKALTMERYERSLLEVLKREKVRGDREFASGLKTTAFPSMYMPEVPDVEQESDQSLELSTVLDVGEQKAEKPALSVDDFLKDGMIRFECECGKPVKIPKKYSGRTGKCPKCKRRLDIPDISTR
jgi:membrane associated rhomboid family serine protease